MRRCAIPRNPCLPTSSRRPPLPLNDSARALLSLSAAEGDSASKLQRTVHALELQSLSSSPEISRAFPSAEPLSSSSSSSSASASASAPAASAAAVVVVNFSEEGSSAPVASLVVVQAPVGDASAAAVAAELAQGIAASVAGSPDPASVLLLAALRLPDSDPKSSNRVFWGGDHEGFSRESSGVETLGRDARISDGFISALALSLSLSIASPRSSVALAAVDGRRPPVAPLFSSSSCSPRKGEAAAAADEGDLDALGAASALGESAAGALGLKFSRARAARLAPSRAALLEAAASASPSLSGPRASAAAPPPLPLLQGAELMYG